MNESLNFRDIQKVGKVVVTRYAVQKREKKGWFKTETFIEEVKKSIDKYVLSDGKITQRVGNSFCSDGIHTILYVYEDGKEISHQSFDANGYLVSDSKSEYYPNKKIKRNIIISNGQIDHDDSYSYDNQDNIIERSSDWRSGSTLHHSRYNYKWIYGQGFYGRKSICIDFSNGSKTEYNYDFENRLKKKIEYDKEGKIVSSIEYIYNLQGKECKRIINGSYGEEEKFDVYGNTVYMKWYPNFYNLSEKDKFVSAVTTIEYRYDFQGNWLSYKQYRDGVYNLYITREIEYK